MPCVQQCKYILEIVTKNSMAMHVSAFYKVYKKIVILEWYNSNFNKVLFFSPKIVPFLFLHTLLELLVFELQCTKSQNNYVQCMNILTELYCFLKGSTIAIGYRIWSYIFQKKRLQLPTPAFFKWICWLRLSATGELKLLNFILNILTSTRF